MKRWTRYRMRAAMRLHGPTSAIFRRRLAIVGTAFDVTFDYEPLDATITRDDRMRLAVVAYLGESREE